MTPEALPPPPTPKVVVNLGRPRSGEVSSTDQAEANRVVQRWRTGSAMLGMSDVETEPVLDTSAEERDAHFKSLFGAKTDAVIDAEAKRKMSIGEVDIEFSEESLGLVDGLTSFIGAKVSGLKHLSKRPIPNKTLDKREPKYVGTFGSAFYMGANNPIAKTTLGEITDSEHYRYDVEVTGNVLVMKSDAYDLAGMLLPDEVFEEFLARSENISMAGASMLLEHPINGVMYDALIIYNETETKDGPYIVTEAITKKPEECVRIVSETHVPKPTGSAG